MKRFDGQCPQRVFVERTNACAWVLGGMMKTTHLLWWYVRRQGMQKPQSKYTTHLGYLFEVQQHNLFKYLNIGFRRPRELVFCAQYWETADHLPITKLMRCNAMFKYLNYNNACLLQTVFDVVGEFVGIPWRSVGLVGSVGGHVGMSAGLFKFLGDM